MGPRHEDRGEPNLGVATFVTEAEELQWGHGTKTVEN